MSLAYLKGNLAALHRRSGRTLATVEVGGVGYEVQVLSRWAGAGQGTIGDVVQVFVHLLVREDRLVLYGFGTAAERDLFRQLIAVSGIGPQLAIALMDGLELPSLVQAIVNSNTRLLAKTPGVGPKTAERIALELKTKLAEWRDETGLANATPAAGPVPEILEEVELTLLALGYTNREVVQAVEAVGRQRAIAKTADAEDWIREAIAWLSQNST
jgi:Holliday junction DNA helicase RuvA